MAVDIRRGGPGRLPASLSRLRDLADEVRAQHAENADLADELTALSRRIELAFRADRPDVALSVAGRLDSLAASLRRRSAA